MSLKNINQAPRLTQHLITSGAFQQKPVVIVDIGARGGFEEHWSVYKDRLRLIGFEADATESERLNRQEQSSGKRFYPFALHKGKGRKTFYSTAYPPSSGFYKPDMKLLQRFPDKVNLAVKKTLELDTIDFDSFATENNIDYVDFIKLDTESSELDILKGAVRTLRKSVTGLSIEIWFQPWHTGQPVFNDIDTFLRSFGFKLFDLDVYHINREALPEIKPSLDLGPTKWGQIISGEALYLRDGVEEITGKTILENGWDEENILKLASVMELFCLPDCAAELIQVAHRQGYIKDKDVNHLLDLLVPATNGKYVSYNTYLENVLNIKQRGYTSNTYRVKSWIPLSIRKLIGVILLKLREKIDRILK